MLAGVLLIGALAGCTAPGSNRNSSSASITQSPSPGSNANMDNSFHDKITPGGMSGNYFWNMATDSSDLDWWKASYSVFNGWITRGFRFPSDSEGRCILQADVTTEAGELDITVMDAEGKELSSYKNIPTSTFDIDLGKGGDYQIKADARNHKGSFSIKLVNKNE